MDRGEKLWVSVLIYKVVTLLLLGSKINRATLLLGIGGVLISPSKAMSPYRW